MELKAEIGAVVARIEVGVGDAVGAGDTVMVLEVMKMECPAEAPVAGTVASILVTEGDLVEEGQVLARLEAAS